MNGAAGGEIVLYDAGNGETGVEVRLEQDTVWLSQQQMAQVFETTRQNVLMHLGNVFETGELAEEATSV